MMKLRSFFCFILLCITNLAHAQILAPESVEQGQAFKIIINTDSEENIKLSWLGKQINIMVHKNGEKYQALAFLPMPLKAKGEFMLRASQNNKNIDTIKIKAKKVKWEQQTLKVEPKFVSPPPEVQERIKREQDSSREVLSRLTPQAYFYQDDLAVKRPVNGAISSSFGGERVFNNEPRSQHRGVDLRGPSGTPVKAMLAGKIALARDYYFSGQVIYIDHGLGIVSVYAHLSKILVQEGQIVKAGELIGEVGATGRVTGPHLHLSLSILSEAVDPLKFISLIVK